MHLFPSNLSKFNINEATKSITSSFFFIFIVVKISLTAVVIQKQFYFINQCWWTLVKMFFLVLSSIRVSCSYQMFFATVKTHLTPVKVEESLKF